MLLERTAAEPTERIGAVVSAAELADLMSAVDEVHFDPSLADYLLAIVQATRTSARLSVGVSTRGALALARASKAAALVAGRGHVLPADIKELSGPVLAHRVSMGTGESVVGSSRAAAEAVIGELVSRIEVPL